MAAKIALNKTALKSSRDKLGMYQRYLPSLDLKRQQLMLELQSARQQIDAYQQQMQQALQQAEEWIGLLANTDLRVHGLVKVVEVVQSEQNLLGVSLPVFEQVYFQTHDYSKLTNPFWVDALVETLKSLAQLRVKIAIGEQRCTILEKAVRKITQRVNLFEKRLIPEAHADIRKIKIFLDDSQRASVVRAKFAKKKTLSRVEQGG